MAKRLGRVLWELREEAHLSIAALARAAGLDPGALSRLESEDRTHVRFATVCQIAEALGVPMEEIAARAGLIRPQGSRKSPQAQAASLLEEVVALERGLDRARQRLENIKKTLK